MFKQVYLKIVHMVLRVIAGSSGYLIYTLAYGTIMWFLNSCTFIYFSLHLSSCSTMILRIVQIDFLDFLLHIKLHFFLGGLNWIGFTWHLHVLSLLVLLSIMLSIVYLLVMIDLVFEFSDCIILNWLTFIHYIQERRWSSDIKWKIF